MKLMAIDYGTKRVGIASTDDSGRFALPRLVLENDKNLLEHVLRFATKEDITKVIMGESKNFGGGVNKVQREIEKFKHRLEERGLEVVFHPEILTTVEARRLQGNTEMTDASAAALILKSFLDTVV